MSIINFIDLFVLENIVQPQMKHSLLAAHKISLFSIFLSSKTSLKRNTHIFFFLHSCILADSCSCVTQVTINWDNTGGSWALDEPPPGVCLCVCACFSLARVYASACCGPHVCVRACSCMSGLVSTGWIKLDERRPANSRRQCHPNTETFPQTPAGFSAEH